MSMLLAALEADAKVGGPIRGGRYSKGTMPVVVACVCIGSKLS